MDVFIRQNLCPSEEIFIKQRQCQIKEALHRHGIPEDYIPRVALLGSGGGQRASIALLGVLQEVAKEDLLDLFLYVAGVSGSTWCMSSLYEDSKWSQHAEENVSKALRHMSEGKGVTFSEGVRWLRGRNKEGDLSLTDFWGVLTSRIKGEHLETRLLQGDGGDGTNPYPLYSAIERHIFDKEEKKPKAQKTMCFEFSPEEVGFLVPGAYTETAKLKMDFDKGHVSPKQPFKRQPIDMVQLQGICSSFMGDFFTLEEYLLDWIHSNCSDDEKHHVVFLLADLALKHAKTEHSLFALEKLKHFFKDYHGEFSTPLKDVSREKWTSMHCQERKTFCNKLVSSVGEFARDLIEVEGTLRDVWWVIKHVTPLLESWNFGTVSNFLYHFQDPAIPSDMSEKEEVHLIDAGLYLNSPYPSALRPARKIDLIVSFDFSGNPFETLWLAREYAASNNLPFPEVYPFDFEKADPRHPQSFYVFEEEGKPTVIHMPLFNMDNCKDPEEIERNKHDYRTFQVFSGKAKIDHLAELAAMNVKINRDNILTEIRKAALRHSGKH